MGEEYGGVSGVELTVLAEIRTASREVCRIC